MMQPCHVVGVNSYDFNNSSGQHVSGYSYFLLLEPSDPSHFLGLEPKKVSISTGMMQQLNMRGAYIPTVGSACWVDFDSKGKLLAFREPDSMPGFVPLTLDGIL